MQKLFSSSSPFDHDVEKATSELNTNEDWGTILQICDNVEKIPNGAKECLRSVLKRLNSNIPHQAMHTLTLLDACVLNCSRSFHLAICSRDVEAEFRKIINKGHPKVAEKLKTLLKKWSDLVFKDDPELGLIPALYENIAKSDTVNKSLNTHSLSTKSHQDENDLAKAIVLSLENASTKQQSSLYPSVNSSTLSKEAPRKVRAMYDFEAAEENELTFKANDIIGVLDDSDANWWKGMNFSTEKKQHSESRKVGLFPSNFVTTDLTAEPEGKKSEKTVHFSDEVERVFTNAPHTKTSQIAIEEVKINESEIDKLLAFLHDADPTEDGGQDPEELLKLEDQCLAMCPLIDKELSKIDRLHANVTNANEQIVQATKCYQMLMKENISSVPFNFPVQDIHYPVQPTHQQVFGPPISPYNMPMPTLSGPYPPPAQPSAEHYSTQVPPAGSLANALSSRAVHGSHPQISFSVTNQNSYASIPQTTMPLTTGNFSAPLLSRDQNGISYGERDMAVTHMNSA